MASDRSFCLVWVTSPNSVSVRLSTITLETPTSSSPDWPGAVMTTSRARPSIVLLLPTRNGEPSWISMSSSKTTHAGSSPVTASRNDPGPESASVVTCTSGPSAPPRTCCPKPSRCASRPSTVGGPVGVVRVEDGVGSGSGGPVVTPVDPHEGQDDDERGEEHSEDAECHSDPLVLEPVRSHRGPSVMSGRREPWSPQSVPALLSGSLGERLRLVGWRRL